MSTIALPEVQPIVNPREVPADALPDWLKLPRRAVWVVLFLGVIFWSLSWAPLWHTDLWVHLKCGQWICSNRQLPATEHFMPLAEGMPYLDDAWLGQVILFAIHSTLGLDGLSLLYAGTLVAIIGLLLATCYRATSRMWLAMLAVTALIPLLWPHFMAFSPRLFGALCFVVLVYLATGRPWHVVNWLLVPVLFLFWVNLDSSFMAGWSVLACCVLGRAADAWRKTKHFGSVFRDSETVRWFWVSELALVTCLANPYGTELFQTILSTEHYRNMQSLADWEALSSRSGAGITFAASIATLVWLLRVSKKPVPGTEGLLMLVFGLASLPHTEFTFWWWLLIPGLYLPHIAEILERLRPRACYGGVRTFKNTFMAAALAWIIFACSGPGFALIHHKPRKLETILGQSSPIETTDYLRQYPPSGLIFNPVDWGDWLIWQGPRDIECLVTSQVHLVPEEIWTAYQQVYLARGDWDRTLQILGIRTMVIDKQQQKELLNQTRHSSMWKIVHEDRLGVVAERVRSGPDTPAQAG